MKVDFGPSPVRRCALSLLAAVMLLLTATAAPAQARFTRGFAGEVWFDGVNQHRWIAKTQATGAKRVLIEVDWASIEPRKPSSSAAAINPAGSQYDFTQLDQRVQLFRGTGLQPVLMVTDAPRWAEGRGGNSHLYATGGYRPNARAFGHLAKALAKRYSGHYVVSGKRLPRVRYYQAWAEANLKLHLSPQWKRRHGHWVNVGPTIYRRMLNSFYAGIKSRDRHAHVLTAGFTSYGDSPSYRRDRSRPVVFLRNLFCLNAKLHRRCGSKAHFDILASDPYEVGPPTTHALSPLDASAPDLGRLRRVVRAASRAGTLLPRRHKPLWVTEFGYDSRPPNPDRSALSLAKQARWLDEALYVFWRQHVGTVLWYLVRDQPPPYTGAGGNYASGVYFRNGKRKKSFRAYRFPLVVMAAGNRARIWGMTPVRGTVKVQRRSGRRWRTIARFHRRGGAVFSRKIPKGRHGRYRAVVHGQHSRVWKY